MLPGVCKMIGLRCDRFNTRWESQLVSLGNGVMLLPEQPKEENQFQTFAHLTIESGLV